MEVRAIICPVGNINIDDYEITTGTLGERIAIFRKDRGYRQIEFAKLLGIKQSSLSELENGKSRSPSAEVLLRMCKLLKLRPEYILFGELPAEAQTFSELDGTEGQLVMLYRQLSREGRQAVLADLHQRAEAEKSR